MSHYEERLENDLNRIRECVAGMSAQVEDGVKNALLALLSGDHTLAAATILGDHGINRTMREIDRLCHAFIAVHLPSAGHLRLLSSIIRANIELERIGDYAATIARESLQLSTPPTGSMATELERVGGEIQHMLRQSIEAFNDLNPDMARSTMVLEEQMENNLDDIHAELMANNDRETVKNVLTVYTVFTQLKRVADQSKNLCEETLFAATGDTKPPKIYNVLFIDEGNGYRSQIAEALARKYFPGSGIYTSAGRTPGTALDPGLADFLEHHGVNMNEARPKPLDSANQALSSLHLVISLQGPVSTYIEQLPFHTTPLEWDLGDIAVSEDSNISTEAFEEIYRSIAVKVRDLMQTMRGEGAP